MGITPQDIRDKKFSTVRGFREGYHLAEVDSFLAEVQAEVSRLRDEIDALRADGNGSQSESNVSAMKMLELAQRTADDHLSAAHQEAERIIADARDKVARISEEADAQRTSLERRVEDLRAFEREYRARLRTFIEGQMNELEGRGQD
jgi:DivIVA domain-containing protein